MSAKVSLGGPQASGGCSLGAGKESAARDQRLCDRGRNVASLWLYVVRSSAHSREVDHRGVSTRRQRPLDPLASSLHSSAQNGSKDGGRHGA